MIFQRALATLAFAWTVSAYSVSHTIVVGDRNGSIIYTPAYLNAKPGDFLVFQFQQKNHSVVQSSFGDPCSPLAGGFKSEFFPVPANQTDEFPTFTVRVENEKPIWAYCAQNAGLPNSHCGAGMVFAANPGDKFPAFLDKARAIGAALKASASTTAATTSATASPTQTAPGTQHTVVVGNRAGETIFTPDYVNAKPGDELVFQFQQKNHSVVQSSFQDPCTSNGGFNSGFRPVPPQQADNFETFVVPVKDEKPIWVYCAQNAGLANSHCAAGMVFAANPGDKFADFKAKARAVGAPTASTPPAPPYAAQATHTVVVGNAAGATIFVPPYLDANPGDKVVFQFQQKNHSVVQSSFNDPCTFNGGFNSGFFPVPANQTQGFPTYTIDIKDKNPVWAYCAQNAGLPNSHCGMGMVWAANAGPNFAAFKQKALDIGASLRGTGSSAPPTAAKVTVTVTVTVEASPTTVYKTWSPQVTRR